MSLADKVRSQIKGAPTPAAAAPSAAPAPVPAPVAAAPVPAAATAPTPAARKIPLVGVEVAACDIGARYIIDGVAMDGVFTGTSLGFGFFATAQGDMKLPANAMVAPAPMAAPASVPAPVLHPAASPAPVPQTAPTLVAVPAPVASAPIAQAAAPTPAGAPVAVAAPPWAAGGGAPVAGAASAPSAEKPKRSRKIASASIPVEAAAPTAADASAESAEFMLYVDCIPNAPYTLLDQYIAQMVESTQQAGGNLADIRFPPNAEHAYSFGRWKGALAAMVKSAPPAHGLYVVFSGGDFAEVVIEALVPMCAPGALTRAR